MSLEQQSATIIDIATLPKGDISIGKHYHTEKAPLYRPIEIAIEKLRQKPSVPILHFIREVESLLPYSPAPDSPHLFAAVLDTALDLWSLRQEMTGEQNTIQVVNPLEWIDHEQQFDLQCFQIQQKLFSSPEWIPWSHRAAYRQESSQVLKRIQATSKQIESIDFSQPKNTWEKQLQSLGFHKEYLPITPGMVRHFPHLREHIHTYEDIENLIKGDKKALFWVGPNRSMTGSAPHWLHSNGETTFLWVSDLIVSLEAPTPVAAIIEHGKYSYTKLPTLLRYLSFGQTESTVVSSRAQVLDLVSSLSGHTDIPPVVFLNTLIKEVGNFIPAQPFDHQVVGGDFPMTAFLQEIKRLYLFEWTRIANNSTYKTGLYERLLYAADQIRQLVADNSTKGLPEIIDAYQTSVFGTEFAATHPTSKRSSLREIGMSVNPQTFSRVFDWSLFDCVAGTPTSMFSSLQVSAPTVNASFGTLEPGLAIQSDVQKIGTRRYDALYTAQQHGIHTQEELEAFCPLFGLNASDFHPNREQHRCVGRCQKPQAFLGPCQMCPVCNAEINVGITHDVTPLQHDTKDIPTQTLQQDRTTDGVVGIGYALSALMTPQMYNPDSIAAYVQHTQGIHRPLQPRTALRQ